MYGMSIVLKLISILGFIAAVISIFNGEIETAFPLIGASITVLAIGVLFKNLGEAFEDIALMRKRQKMELLAKGILKEDDANAQIDKEKPESQFVNLNDI